jgi:hypothetical protein
VKIITQEAATVDVIATMREPVAWRQQVVSSASPVAGHGSACRV